MQIDFHHGTIYVLARIAGFKKKDAEKLAYASQYTDDAIHGGLINFENGALFKRTFSAHKALDVSNLETSDNLDVWLPFHFLPGNGGNPKGDGTGITHFIQRLVARPNSPVAQDMIEETIRQADKPYGLHRFGIALHVYADTWAHQGFAGIIHEINEAEDPKEVYDKEELSWWERIREEVKAGTNDIIDDVAPPIGHGQVSTLPDMPYIAWSYKDGLGKMHTRCNWECFREAAEAIFDAMTRYPKVMNLQHPVHSIDDYNLGQIENLFQTAQDECGEKRHQVWLEAIENGAFKVAGKPLAEKVSYDASGKNSWKYKALGGFDFNRKCYGYRENFLSSDWKCFHDAVIAHRFYVLHELLPEYGICAG